MTIGRASLAMAEAPPMKRNRITLTGSFMFLALSARGKPLAKRTRETLSRFIGHPHPRATYRPKKALATAALQSNRRLIVCVHDKIAPLCRRFGAAHIPGCRVVRRRRATCRSPQKIGRTRCPNASHRQRGLVRHTREV